MTVVTSYLRNEENVYSLFDLIDLTDMPAILKTHSPVVLCIRVLLLHFCTVHSN